MARSNYRGFAFSSDAYKFDGSGDLIYDNISYMLNRTQRMFEWSNLPDTIPQRSLELFIQTNGHCCITQHEGSFYALFGALGGEPDVYYMPTIYTVANPALAWSANLRIGKDCIVIPNDALYRGLIPLCSKYATMLADNDITMRIFDIMSRLSALISAGDDRTKASVEKMLEQLFKGKLAVIGEQSIMGESAVKVMPTATSGSTRITDLIEYHQYLRGTWLNELGLRANYNSKRESIGADEASLSDAALLPLVDDMLETRRTAVEKINELFELDIDVDLSSSWKDIAVSVNADVDQQVAEAAVTDEPKDEPVDEPEELPEELPEDEPEEPEDESEDEPEDEPKDENS